MYSTKKINDTTRGGRENLLPEKKKDFSKLSSIP